MLKGDTYEGIISSTYPQDKTEEPTAFTNSIAEASATKKPHFFLHPFQPSNPEKQTSSNTTSRFSLQPSTPLSSLNTPPSRIEAFRNSSNNFSTLRQPWRKHKGVPEPLDPVTGRGLHAALTSEDVKNFPPAQGLVGSFGFSTGDFGWRIRGQRIQPMTLQGRRW